MTSGQRMLVLLAAVAVLLGAVGLWGRGPSDAAALEGRDATDASSVTTPGASVVTEAASSPATAPTSQAAETTTTTTTTTTPSTTTTTTIAQRDLRVVAGDEVVEVALSEGGWVLPDVAPGGRALGADLDQLVPFVPPNDGEFGVSIDEQFLLENSGAEWLGEEGGVPVIDGVDASGRCLNILTPLILRNSFVSCPTRIQADSWGYAGEVDDAPAVNIAPSLSGGVLIEHNTITCTGVDANICSRSVRIGSRDAVVRFNDLSFARGAVALFHDSTFVYNYLHDFAFGFDPTRANSETDRVTHNNSVNNLGYQNVTVAGNYIDATYGRVSESPAEFVNPHFRDAYPDGVVSVGDPINGFAFTNYLVNGDGQGAVYTRNYVRGVGRPFRCNSSSGHSDSVCAEDLSFNVFEDLQIDLFNAEPLFEDKDGEGELIGSCNYRIEEGVLSPLALPEQGIDAGCDLILDTQAQITFAEEVASTVFAWQ